MIENRNVGDLLKACRLRANKSQKEMAKHLHVDRSMISRWENDEIPAPYAVVRQWCAYTQGLDLMTIDLGGGIEAWKKLQKYEEAMKRMKLEFDSVGMMRKKPDEGQAKKDGGSRWANLGGLRGRIRS